MKFKPFHGIDPLAQHAHGFLPLQLLDSNSINVQQIFASHYFQ
jgi:hypothetical protein